MTWPWQWGAGGIRGLVQVIGDADGGADQGLEGKKKNHWEYFSNYAVTKEIGEALVRKADKTKSPIHSKALRTGVIRPGNAVYGTQGDIMWCQYLTMKKGSMIPEWTSGSLHSHCFVENCALAHLLYERRLVDLIQQEVQDDGKNGRGRLPDIGGQAFCITDPGPPMTYGEGYRLLTLLTKGSCVFTSVSPTMMLFLAYFIEVYTLAQFFISSITCKMNLRIPAWLKLPSLENTDIKKLTPSMFSLTSAHIVVDDGKARRAVESGGLGYTGVWGSREGVYKVWRDQGIIEGWLREEK